MGGFLVAPARQSAAQPPANDTCADPQELTIGVPVTGSTAEAANDYVAEITPTESGPGTAVPADGADVVYRVELTANEVASVTVKAPFQASIYANIEFEDTGVGDCGLATVIKSTGTYVPFARSGSGALLLIPVGSIDDPPTVYHIVVDGWTADEFGEFEIAVSRDVVVSSGLLLMDNTQAIVGSLLKAIRGLAPTITGVVDEVVAALADKFTQWNFAEGSTRDGFEVFITLVSDVDQTVVVSFRIDPTSPGAGAVANPVLQSVDLVAGQRRTLRASSPAEGGAGTELDFGTRIEGTAPFQASAILYADRDVGLGVETSGVQNIQGEHN